AFFNLRKQLHPDHAAQRENADADENLVGLKSRAGYRDHEPDARRGGVKLAHQHADQGAAHRETQPGENKRDRRGHDDGLEDHPFRSAEAARGVEQIGGRGFDAVAGVDQDRKNRAEKNNADLGHDADAEPDDHQRQERDPRRRVHGVDERIEDIAHALVPAGQDAEGNADHGGESVAADEFNAAHVEVVVDLAAAEHLVGGLEDQRRRAHEHGVDQLKDIPDQLPGDQEGGDRDAAEDFLFLIEVDLVPARGVRDFYVE